MTTEIDTVDCTLPDHNIDEFKLYEDLVDGLQWPVSLTAEYRLS